MLRPPSITGAEALAVSAAVMPASTIVVGYVIDRAGVSVHPGLLLAVLLASGAGAFAWLRRGANWSLGDVLPFVVLVGSTFAWLMWIAAPSFLPLGSGSDLTHHLLLIQYIEEHRQLARDPRLETLLGEMATYTPGSHLLTALTGRWIGVNGLGVLHAVVSASVALKVGFVYVIALRTIGPRGATAWSSSAAVRLPFAVLACVFLFASQVYFLRSFVENSFVAQVVSELFAIVMWWSLVAWDAEPGAASMVIFGLAGAASFLSWPVWIGPPTIAAAVLALLSDRASIRRRLVQLSAAAIPIAIVVVLYLSQRRGGLSMAATGGAAPWPLVANYGWPLLLFSGVGLVLAIARREARATALLAGAIGLQSMALYAVAARSGADAPYLSLKMLYLLLYPQCVAAAMAAAALWSAVIRLSSASIEYWLARFNRRRTETVAAWLLVAWIGSTIARPLAGAPRSLTVLRHPAVSTPLERAGRWARANVPAGCVEYLVDDPSTAYRLHLAVLGNPRISARSIESRSFEPGWAIARWLTAGGRPYAIADLPTLPRGVREELEIIQQFDTAAVARRRGQSSCADAP